MMVAFHLLAVANVCKICKEKTTHLCGFFNGDPGGIRTPGLLIRSQTLYPAELLSHI